MVAEVVVVVTGQQRENERAVNLGKVGRGVVTKLPDAVSQQSIRAGLILL